MKKFLVVLILCIFILSGFRAFAFPNNRHIGKNPLMMQELGLKIIIYGDFFGYTATAINTGPVQLKGNLSINISTDAMFVFLGETISLETDLDLNPINGFENFNLKPLLGFGSASISISGYFDNDQIKYTFNNVTSGYAFVIFILCDETIIKLPQ